MNESEKSGRAIGLIGGQEKRAIVIVPYRDEWRARFEHHARRIGTTLGTTALRIEHIGSTAVEGLSAKPTIDILVAVSDPSREDLYLNEMLASGYELRVREPDFEEHRMFRTAECDVHVHVYPESSREVGRYLLFRDYLRANPTTRDRYAALKSELSTMDWADMNQYAEAKTDFIESVIEQAGKASKRVR